MLATLRQPFDLISETTARSACQEAADTDHSPQLENWPEKWPENWLPFLNTYRTMCLAPQPEFRRLLEKMHEMLLAA